MNIISLLTIINFYFNKSKLNYLSLAFLFPNIFLFWLKFLNFGIYWGYCILLLVHNIFKFPKIKKLRNLLSFTLFCFLITSLILFSNKLPSKFDYNSIQTFQPEIPSNLIDIHRQFIWGFSIEKYKEKIIFGFGPDTSNFIKGGQKEIGLPSTGDMNFIPSHPHNFIIELLLETGLLGISFFCLFLIIVNLHILKISKSLRSQIFIIFLILIFGLLLL